jgi:hypothetical protein
MIVRAGTGWQTLMADLSIILFMVTAAALSQAGPGPAAAAPPQTPAAPSPRGEPIAVYRSGTDAPPLGAWLDDQPRDSRQMLTVLSTYTPGQQSEAMTRAANYAAHAAQRRIQVRVVVEPGTGDATATLAYDLALQPTFDADTPG